jgi:hypothetical protein
MARGNIGGFVPSSNRIQIKFDKESIDKTMGGCLAVQAFAATIVYRYSREVALNTYRELVKSHPRDTRFSVRQIQVSYTMNRARSTRGETYDPTMSKWVPIWTGDHYIFRMKRKNETVSPPYPDPEQTQLQRVRFLSGVRKRSVLMPAEVPEYANWSGKKSIYVFSNVHYEKYLNYGSDYRPGLYYWESSFSKAVDDANMALATVQMDQAAITNNVSVVAGYNKIINSFLHS